MVHGGLLAIRDNETHTDAMRDHGIGAIDLLVVNLYPFEETVRGGGAYEACIENIDIGGPAMIRAAAKNHQDVTVIVDPEDYANVLDSLQTHQGTQLALRQRLAQKAYARTAAYDAEIQIGWPPSLRSKHLHFARLAGICSRVCAMAKTRINRPDFMLADHCVRGRNGAAGTGQGAFLQQYQ